MVTFTYKCSSPSPDCQVGEIELRISIKEKPPERVICSCGVEATRVWHPTVFICDRADADAGR